ncbi:MAG TPA: Ig-like domain-containing protein [Urbifossiella sp.]|jgi:hypothetical protein|nr:Ig-like domain-containing protein [Urbifossiella sp.]
MPGPTGARRTILAVHPLEPRDVPAGFTDSFNTPGATPGAGWDEWSSTGTDLISVAAGTGFGGTSGAVSNGTSTGAGLAWWTDPATASAATGASAKVKLDSLVPTLLFARGTNLDTSAPSYVAVAITRGASVQVWDVQNGQTTVRSSVAGGGASYFSGGWVTVSLVPSGSTVAVQVKREDTGQYLTPQGTWQAAAVNVIQTQTAVTGNGSVGIGRAARYAGPVSLDDFQVLTPAPVSVTQTFDSTAVGAKPAGWAGWSSDATSAFAVSAARAESPADGFASTGGSAAAARAWSTTALPAAVDASAAVYLDSLIPAQLLVRGSNLNTATPTYYAVDVTRGLNAQLVKVVNGVETPLAAVNSATWFSSQWLRVRLTAVGTDLRVMLYRADTRQWLTPAGTWSSSPQVAIEVHDSSITAAGLAGVGREARYSGTVTVDDFTAQPASAAAGPTVTITGISYPDGSTAGDITFDAAATGNPARIEFVIGGQVMAAATSSPAEWTFDTTTVPNGTYTLTVRAFDAAGNVGSVDYTFKVSNPDNGPVPKPTIPQHLPNIRIAELAYAGTPIGATEQSLLQNDVDLVIPNPSLMPVINAAAPNTPQMLYTNVSNLYQGLLADWDTYADDNGISREDAFYHVTQATPFTGSSPSSQPVTWFWGAYQSVGAPQTAADVTSAAHGGASTNIGLGGAGEWTAIGSLEEYREINMTMASTPAAGWGGVWEYVSATDPAGNPVAWKPLTLIQDGTAGLTGSGRITFDPPADWKVGTVGGSAPEYYVRFRVTGGTAAQAPQVKTILGRDYVNAAGGQSGVIPAFDASADTNHDGYLSDAEYATRKPGMDARFEYESRLFYPGYGQMRFVTNPGSAAVRRWAAEYATEQLAANPLADGLFLDNATGKLPFSGVSVVEPTDTYSADSGSLVAAVNRAIAPKWVLANTAGGGAAGNAVAAGAAGAMEEALIRPLAQNWSEFGDTANLVAGRLAAAGSPYLVIDSRTDGGAGPQDPRTQLATLAEYYLLSDPKRTFLMFYGGQSPSTSWSNHWSQAAAINIGTPTGAFRTLATGADPQNRALTYKVFARDFTNGLVVYKPLSYATGAGAGTTADQTATTQQLGGSYRQVNADGSLGPVVTSVTLRNGEGAVFVKA